MGPVPWGQSADGAVSPIKDEWVSQVDAQDEWVSQVDARSMG